MENKSSPTAVSVETFRTDYCAFRELMGDKRNAIEKVDKAFGILFGIYLRATTTDVDTNTTPQNIKMMELSFLALNEEWAKRKTMLMFKDLRELVYA